MKNNLITTRLLILLIFGGLLFICMSSASAASGDHIYVNGSSGSDTNDGLTPQTAKLTIKNATKTVNNGGTITISGGTYSGAGNSNIRIDRSMAIMGAGKNKTIISGLDSSNIFLIANNANFILSGVTITNGNSKFGGGIYSEGYTSIDNCVFTKCKTTYGYLGGGSAICIGDDGALAVSNTDFISNDASLSSTGGGTIYSNGTLSLSNCTFTGNKAYSGGCVYSFNGDETFDNCVFINNSAASSGGVLTLYSSDVNVRMHFCSFVNNTANQVSQTNNIDNRLNNNLNVNSCWWGSNNGPNGIYEDYTADNWILMMLKADKYYMKGGDTSKFIANFNNLYNPSTQITTPIDPSINHIPDGLIVDFSTDLGTITTPGLTQNGVATAIYTGKEVGTGTVKESSGNQKLQATVTVDPLDTNVNVHPAQNYPGQTVDLIADVSDENGYDVNGGYVTFTINDQNINVPVINGLAIAQWTIPSSWKAGIYMINANYDGTDTIYGDSGATSKLMVMLIPTQISSDDVTGEVGDKVAIKAHLEDIFGNGLEGQKVHFNIKGSDITGTTDYHGDVTVYYPITGNPGNYNIIISFPGANPYELSSYTSKLTVNKIPTSITVSDTKGARGDHVDLQATLKDENGNPISGKDLVFYVNGSNVGSATTNNEGVAIFNYQISENPGIYTVNATLLNDPLYQDSTGLGTLTVNHLDTKITVTNVTGKHGEKTNLTAVLKDVNGNPLSGKTVTFSIGNNVIGTATTDATGTATLSYTITQTIGSYTITANFQKDDIYSSSTGTGTLTVNPIETNLTVKNVSGKHGANVNLKAVLTDEYGNPLSGKTVAFYISNIKIGTAITDATGTATLSYTITQTMGNYVIYANSYADDIYEPSRNLATLTVNPITTHVTVPNTTVKHGDKSNLVAVLTDENGNALAGQTITFSINGKTIGTATTDSTGTATLYYLGDTSGNFNINAVFNGNNVYSGSNGTGKLNVTPWAGLYIKTTVNNTHPKVGEKFTINYKLGNSGPDTAYNVVVSFKIPPGLEFVTGNTDSGTWSFDPVTRTLTWTLNNVVVGDPNLKITLKALKSGNYTIIPTITSNTTANVTQNGTVNIEVIKNNNNNTNNTNGTGNNTNHNTKLPKTGLPIAPLIVGLLMVIGGIAVKK
ncbi:conserved repeat domain protein [Methanobacterium lacus]|uniref:Conserved repeat domain protein n=1 Tax=Methanobacterium lacus (strain AL-21) TaxID=877455 RepID=F0T8Z9_METLA|nr:Ig-like domain repeat protein [Methanobacterium lacus]ADZ09827.1 conserved repeat domain protein [Methanobacterium lacus]